MKYFASLLVLTLRLQMITGSNTSLALETGYSLQKTCPMEMENKPPDLLRLEKFEQYEKQDIFKLNINNIIQDLLHHHWKADETLCLKKLLDILQNVQNHTLWATWIWDSMQMPTGVLFGSNYQLGDFDECLHPPWIKTHPDIRTQYCLADVVLAEESIKFQNDPFISAELYVKSITKNRLKLNSMTWGVCLPVSCEPQSTEKFLKTLLGNSHLGFALSELTLKVDSCQSYVESPQLPLGFYAIFILIAVMAILVTWATCFYNSNKHTKSIVTEFAKGLSVVKNTAELGKVKNDDIPIIHFIKSIVCTFMVYLHNWVISSQIGFSNALDIDMKFEQYLYVSYHLDIFVDIFMLISGILIMRGFMADKKSFNPVKTVIKRYFRLVSIMMIMILFISQSLKHLQSGPLMPKMTLLEVDTCRENWWLNLLMINNYVNFPNTCYIPTWYVSCDFHFTILGTFLFWLYQKNKRVGVCFLISIIFASILLPALVTYKLRLPAFPVLNLESNKNLRQLFNVPTYSHSHLRTGPYIVGMIIGHILSTYEPAKYKKFSKFSSTACTVLVAILSLSVLVVGGFISIREYNVIEASTYASLNRFIWAIAIGSFILIHEYGYLPVLHDFVRLKSFVTVSKLSYGIYLTHWILISRKIFVSRSAILGDIFYMIVDSLGVMWFCCMVSYVLWLLFEAPVNNIVAILLRYRSFKEP